MTRHFDTELGAIQQELLRVSARVEKAVHEAVACVEDNDIERARRVIASDEEIDQAEVELEEECLKVLALHQPVAIDLRMVIAVIKMNNDLERIGDLATNMAKRVIAVGGVTAAEHPFNMPAMAALAEKLLRKGLDAVINLNTEEAREVIAMDDQLDNLHDQAVDNAKAQIRDDVECLDTMINLMGISRSFERIGDHATNIAEDLIYLVEGEIIRHHHDDADA